jgi:CDP-diacylglycerol--serine O-phosphatidyltransferase
MFFYLGRGAETTKHITVLILVYILAFFMISNIKYYSFKELSIAQRMPFRLLVGLIFLLIAIAAEPIVMLFILTFGYVASGPVTTLIDRRRRSAARSANKPDKKESGGIGLTR